MGRDRVARILVLSSLILSAGCALVLGFDDTTLRAGDPVVTPPTEDAGEAGTAAALSVDKASIVLRRGGRGTIAVTLARGGSLRGQVVVTAENLPTGVTATPATIAADQTTAVVDLTAASDAPFGSRTVRLTASAPELAPVTVSVLVAGPSGSADVTFGGTGQVADATRGALAAFYSLAIQGDGKVLAGGISGVAGNTPAAWLLRRYNEDGTADASFLAALPTDGELRAVAVDPKTGKIFCVGSSAPGGVGVAQVSIARLLPTGAIDAAFGGGVVRLTLADAPAGSTGLGVTVGADGSVFVVGSRKDGLGEAGLVAKFSSNGVRDMSFGNGLVVVAQNRFVGVSQEADGAITLVGTDGTAGVSSYYLSRRTPAGALDPTFGTSGVLVFGKGYRANRATRLPDGSIVVVGDSAQATQYTAGRASSVGAQVWVSGVATGQNVGYYGVAPRPDGTLVLAGHSTAINGEARVDGLLADGGKDITFGSAGTAVIEPGGVANNVNVTLFATQVAADGRILVAGNRSTAGAIVMRLWP